MLNRWDKTSGFHFYPIKENYPVQCSPCPDVPNFVRDMDPNLFSQIQGMVPFSQSEDSYLILFNISNRLKYCLTKESEVWHNFDIEFN